AQRCRGGVNQSAFNTVFADSRFSAQLMRLPLRIDITQGKCVQGLTGKPIFEVGTPLNIKTAVTGAERMNLDALSAQQRSPTAIGTQSRPAAPTQCQQPGSIVLLLLFLGDKIQQSPGALAIP